MDYPQFAPGQLVKTLHGAKRRVVSQDGCQVWTEHLDSTPEVVIGHEYHHPSQLWPVAPTDPYRR